MLRTFLFCIHRCPCVLSSCNSSTSIQSFFECSHNMLHLNLVVTSRAFVSTGRTEHTDRYSLNNPIYMKSLPADHLSKVHSCRTCLPGRLLWGRGRDLAHCLCKNKEAVYIPTTTQDEWMGFTTSLAKKDRRDEVHVPWLSSTTTHIPTTHPPTTPPPTPDDYSPPESGIFRDTH